MQNLCQVCQKPVWGNSVLCRKCYLVSNKGGRLSPRWKGGIPKCQHCGKELQCYESKSCRKCYVKNSTRENHPSWKGGMPKCKDCGNTLGDRKSVRCRKCKGIMQRGENNPNYNGGKFTRDDGYVLIFKPGYPESNKRGYVYEHRYVMAEHLKRRLTKTDIVHHINENTSDRIENLELTTPDGHKKKHLGSRIWSKEEVQDMINLYNDGKTLAEIAHKYNCTPQGVYYWVRKSKTIS